jgi:hypothetical protein
MDTLLTLAEERIFTWVWTDELIEEWERVIVGEQRRSAESAATIVKVVQTFFGSERMEPSKYLPVTDESTASAVSGRCPTTAPQPTPSSSNRGAVRLNRRSCLACLRFRSQPPTGPLAFHSTITTSAPWRGFINQEFSETGMSLHL